MREKIGRRFMRLKKLLRKANDDLKTFKNIGAPDFVIKDVQLYILILRSAIKFNERIEEGLVKDSNPRDYLWVMKKYQDMSTLDKEGYK